MGESMNNSKKNTATVFNERSGENYSGRRVAAFAFLALGAVFAGDNQLADNIEARTVSADYVQDQSQIESPRLD